MEKVPMTAAGFRALEDELKILKSEERPAVIAAISEAREHGDLSENAEYHAARERQSFIEGRITELEDVVSRAEVIDILKMGTDMIRFGATVTLADDETDEEVTYQIVGAYEADLKAGRISLASPIAKAVIGRAPGETVEVKAPGGSRFYEIVAIKYV